MHDKKKKHVLQVFENCESAGQLVFNIVESGHLLVSQGPELLVRQSFSVSYTFHMEVLSLCTHTRTAGVFMVCLLQVDILLVSIWCLTAHTCLSLLCWVP